MFLMNHDPLCPLNDEQWPKHPLEKCHYCDLIAKVREDERARHQGQSVMLASDAEAALAEARAEMLNKFIAGIELWPAAALRQRTKLDGTKEPLCFLIDKADVLEVLRRLQEQP